MSPFPASFSRQPWREDKLVEVLSVVEGSDSNRHSIVFLHIPPGRLYDSASWVSALGANWRHACVVPEGAPLFEHCSTVRNVRLLAELAGRAVSIEDAIFALRAVEVPDRLHHVTAGRLAKCYRLAVWIAVARVTCAPAFALDNPFEELNREESLCLAALLTELVSVLPIVFVAGPDPSVAGFISRQLGSRTAQLS